MKITFFNSSTKKKNQQSSEDDESKGGRKEEMVKISFWQKMSEDFFSLPFFNLIWIFFRLIKRKIVTFFCRI
jgi:hypothetical protein